MSLLSCICHVCEHADCLKLSVASLPVCLGNKHCRVVMVTVAICLAFICVMDSIGKEDLEETLPPGGATASRVAAIDQLRVQRQVLGIKGMSWTVTDLSDSANPTFLYTQGELFSWHNSGHTRSSETDELLAYWSDTFWSLRSIWEIYTYNNTCAVPLKGALNDGKFRVYPFARMTQRFLSLHSHFTVERYECDGSLKEVWDIVPTYWLAALHHWLVREPSGRLVGTIDEKVSMFRHTFDAKMSADLDRTLFAQAVIFAGRPRDSSGGGSGSKSGGAGGNLRGGVAAAR